MRQSQNTPQPVSSWMVYSVPASFTEKCAGSGVKAAETVTSAAGMVKAYAPLASGVIVCAVPPAGV